MRLMQMIMKQLNRFLIRWKEKQIMNNNDYMYYDEQDFRMLYNNTFSDDEVVDFDDLTERSSNNE